MASDLSALRTKLTGICPAAQPHALAELLRRHPAPVWLVIHEEAQKTEALAEDIALFHSAGGNKAMLEILPFPEAQGGEMREAFNAASDRLAVLSKLRGLKGTAANSGTLLILTTPAALLQAVPPPADFATREAELRRGGSHSFQGLLELLRSFDYDSEAVCEAPGQYAVRGGIVDVYPVTAHQPCRLDFFGDLLEEIRALDPVTQRSGETIERVILTAAPLSGGRPGQTPAGQPLDQLGALSLSKRQAGTVQPTYSAEDIVVRPYGSTAALTFRLVAHNPDGTVQYYRNSGTLLLRDGRWQVVTWQATKVPPPEKK